MGIGKHSLKNHAFPHKCTEGASIKVLNLSVISTKND